MRYTYSRWNGTQGLGGLDADALMDALSDDLMSEGDLGKALQRVTNWGVQRDGEQVLPGLHDLLHQLRALRRQELERYDLDTTLRDIEERLDDVISCEREGLHRRVSETETGEQNAEMRQLLESIAERRNAALDRLPDDAGSKVTTLAEYEFLDEQAR